MQHESRNEMTQDSQVRRRLWIAGGLVVLLATVIALWWRGQQAGPPALAAAAESNRVEASGLVVDDAMQQQIGLKTESAQSRPLAQTVRVTGVVGPDETRVAHIRPLARGVIQRLYVRRGDRVMAGQSLVAYDNIEQGEFLAEYATASTALDKASAEADVAKSALNRAENLVEIGGIARAELERRRAEYASALAGVNSQQAQLNNLTRKLRRFGMTESDLANAGAALRGGSGTDSTRAIVRAPFAGVIMSTGVAEGETVDPAGEILSLVNLSTVWVQGDVYEKDIGSIVRGQSIRVRIGAYPDETFVGRLTNVSDALDPNTRTAKVRVEVSNPDARLKLEMLATMEVPTSQPRRAVMVPTAAVQQIDRRAAVFVKTNPTTFEKRDVQAGATFGGWVEIIDGLASGESVVTEGALMLKSQLKRAEFADDDNSRR